MLFYIESALLQLSYDLRSKEFFEPVSKVACQHVSRAVAARARGSFFLNFALAFAANCAHAFCGESIETAAASRLALIFDSLGYLDRLDDHFLLTRRNLGRQWFSRLTIEIFLEIMIGCQLWFVSPRDDLYLLGLEVTFL